MQERVPLRIIMVQAPQLPFDATSGTFYTFESSVRQAVAHAPVPSKADTATLVLFPEMHLFGIDNVPSPLIAKAQAAAAIPLPRKGTPGSGYSSRLSRLAHELGVWLIPGTVCEEVKDKPGAIYNTAAVWSPEGKLTATYRKICPWKPFEKYVPGTSFTVFDIPRVGRVGLTICYDAWFPEVFRQVAWLGAELIVNLVRTTTPDRQQELTLARANAIVNQSFVASLNAPAPGGFGRSVLVGPEGEIIDFIDSDESGIISSEIDLGHSQYIRDNGTLGLNRMWHQFKTSDAAVPLPLYGGSINGKRWQPARFDSPKSKNLRTRAKPVTSSTPTTESVNPAGKKTS
jgi:predicted amidohydrolase